MKCIILFVIGYALTACGSPIQRDAKWIHFIMPPKNLLELQKQLDCDFGDDAPHIKEVCQKVFGKQTVFNDMTYEERSLFWKSLRYIQCRYISDDDTSIKRLFNGSLVSGKKFEKVSNLDILSIWVGVNYDSKTSGRVFNKTYTTPLMSDKVAPITEIDLPVETSFKE